MFTNCLKHIHADTHIRSFLHMYMHKYVHKLYICSCVCALACHADSVASVAKLRLMLGLQMQMNKNIS